MDGPASRTRSKTSQSNSSALEFPDPSDHFPTGDPNLGHFEQSFSWYDDSPGSSSTLPRQVAALTVSPTPFRNDGNIKQWLDRYDVVATLNNWDEQTKIRFLPAFLEGRSYELYSSLRASDKKDWNTVVTSLTRLFGLTDNPLLNFERLALLRQNNRSVQDYANDVLNLTARVDANMPEATRVRHFLVGLRQPLRERLLPTITPRTTLNDVIEQALLYEQAAASPISSSTNAVSMDALEAIITRVLEARLTDVNAVSRRPHPSFRTPTASSSSNLFCNYCKRRGHLINECRTRQRNNARAAARPSSRLN
jgi:hypothetical protein